MKIVICTLKQDPDVSTIIQGQSEKLAPNSLIIEVDNDNAQESLLEGLSAIEDDVIVFVPPNNILVEAPDHKRLQNLSDLMVTNDLDYVRLRRIGVHKEKEISKEDFLWQDTGNLFFLVPYMIKTDVLRHIVERLDTNNQLFWVSLETTGYTGGYYFNPKDQPDQKLSYWRSASFHTLTEILTPLGQWHQNYIDYNNQVLKTLLSEYNIDVEQRGIGSIGGCCV